MIGGDDRVLPWKDTPVLREHLERYGFALWPECRLVKEQDEWFFFKNIEALAAWDRDGGTDANQGTLFTVYFEPTRLTVVTGPGSTIAQEIETNLLQHCCFSGFERSD